MPSILPYLVVRARERLFHNQQGLADYLGTSKRTVQRIEAGRATIYSDQLHKLIDALRPVDPELTAQLEAWAPRRPPPPAPAPAAAAPALPPPAPPAPAAPAPPPSVLVAAVVCAAAEAMNVPPQAIRPSVLAAFKAACDARLAPEAVVAELSPPPPTAGQKKTRATA